MTTQREIAEKLGLPIHPPKVEIFDLPSRTNTDPKQRVRAVDEFRVEPFGLYLARPVPGHHRLTYLRSWLLPHLGIRITQCDYKPGQAPDMDYYIDIADVEPGPTHWRCVDHYLDIEVGQRRYANLVDVDEFILAAQANLLDQTTAQRAMETAYRTVDALARNDYDLHGWLAGEGVEPGWRIPSPR